MSDAAAGGPRVEPDFRWRSGEITRLEGFSDAVFGFAITLLVVSLEVPKTYGELAAAMRGFVAFALCFAILFWIWYEQHTFFRRYGLQDRLTMFLNACLIFLVLFYVYPLKFLFTVLTNVFFGFGLMVPGSAEAVPMIRRGQMDELMLVYSLGFVALFVLFGLLYAHAYRRRRDLQLDPLEAFVTRRTTTAHLMTASVGVVSLLILQLGGGAAAAAAGWIYGVLGPLHGLYWWRVGLQQQRLKRSLEQEPDAPAA